VRRENESRGAL